MNLTALSNLELIKEIQKLTGTEREVTLKILYHLIEIEDRKLAIQLGYSCLYAYCVRELKYSEPSAYRRVAASESLKLNPELGELFLAGKVTLCTMAAARVALREKRAEVTQIIGRSKSEVQALLAPTVESKPKEVIKPVIVKSSAPLFNNTPKEERYEIRFSISKESYQKLTQAKDKLSNSLKRDLTVEGLVSKLVEHYLSPKERRAATISSKLRYIPSSLRRRVFERDHGCCSYVSPDGQRCTESKFLHIDHIVPFAKGGKTELSNLRLLCSQHNKLCAEQQFGKAFIEQKIQCSSPVKS